MDPNEGGPNKVLTCEETVKSGNSRLLHTCHYLLGLHLVVSDKATIIKSFVIITQHSSFVEAKLCERSASSKVYMKRVFAANKLGECAITGCQ